MTFTIPQEFGYVLLSSTAIALQCFLSAFSASKLRKQFNIPYPDTGSGRYTAKLTDKQWEDFNNAQRVHHNYVEQHSITQVLLLTAGLFHPIRAAIAGGVYILGRMIYAHSYLSYGPKSRLYGVLPIDLSLVALLGFSIHGSLKLVQWI